MALDGSKAEYFTEKAREVRALAKAARDTGMKEQYEAKALQYDHLAAQVRSGLLSR